MAKVKFTIEDLQRKGFNVVGDSAVKQEVNRKVINAKKQNVDGINFGSKLELYMYNLLKATKIPFLFQYEIVLMENFRYNGEAIRPIKIIVDFYLKDFDMLIDTKGHQTPDNKIKWKLLKEKLYKEGKKTIIELPSKQNECDALVNKILHR